MRFYQILALSLIAFGSAGCDTTKPDKDTSSGGYAQTLDGLIVVTEETTIIPRMQLPMDHGASVQAGAIDYRAWALTINGETARLKEYPLRYHWKKRLFGDKRPYNLVPVNGKFLPNECGGDSGWIIESDAIRCASTTQWPRVSLAGGRVADFAIDGTTFRFGRDRRCAVDLFKINPDAKKPLFPTGIYMPEDYPMSRFSYVPISADTAYLVDVTLPGMPIFLLNCSTVTPLGTVFNEEEIAASQKLQPDALYFLDAVPDTSVEKPALLRTMAKNDALYQIDVLRADGRRQKMKRIIEDSPSLNWSIGGGGFFGASPNQLLTNVEIRPEAGKLTLSISLYDLDVGDEVQRRWTFDDNREKSPR